MEDFLVVNEKFLVDQKIMAILGVGILKVLKKLVSGTSPDLRVNTISCSSNLLQPQQENLKSLEFLHKRIIVR